MPRSAPVDGFALAYERSGVGPAVVLLHGWPGDRRDYRALAPMLSDAFEVIVPDLRGCSRRSGRTASTPSSAT